MNKLTLEEFQGALRAQDVDTVHLAFVCPMCGTVQSAACLIAAGAGDTLDAVEKYLAFACVGRFLGAGAPRAAPDGKPCNWTLGGLFQLHNLVVVTPDGEHHPRFEPASAEQAAELKQRHMVLE